MKRAAACSLFLAMLCATLTTRVDASPRKKIADVCDGCLATVPDDSDPAPLLVTLHGDWGNMAPDLHRAWERFAAPRNVALLSLACPSKLGCKNSWWQWNGEPSWIVAQIDKLAVSRAIDRDRMWLAGWSGGASYIGMRTQELERTFAGIVIHGGGVWPWPDDCPAQKARVVFLVGDRNPLHKNGLALRDHYARCGNPLSFHLLRGAEHEGEWKALSEKGGAILDELATVRLVHPAPAVSVVEGVTSATTSVAPPTPAVQRIQPVQPRAGCGCDTGGRSASSFLAALAPLALVLRRRARRVVIPRVVPRGRDDLGPRLGRFRPPPKSLGFGGAGGRR